MVPHAQISLKRFGEWVIRLRNKYYRLFKRVLFRTLLSTLALLLLTAGIIKVLNMFGLDIDMSKILCYAAYIYVLTSYIIISNRIAVRTLDSVTTAIADLGSKENEKPIKLSYGLEAVEDSLNRMKITFKDIEIKTNENKRRQNEIVVFLAHDLKTPLTSVVAYLTMLNSREDLTQQERKKYTKTAMDKAIRLGVLINEFFEITKYNLQNIKLDKEIFDVSMMLEQIADEFYGVMLEKNIRCSVEAVEGLYIEGDTDKLARVFENILRNAVNYCRESSMVRIAVTDIGDYVEIVIGNEGDQIPDEKLFTIFEKFYRLDDARSSATGGSGLGLAISKEIIELHEGIIFAESEPEETRFIIKIPKKKEDIND